MEELLPNASKTNRGLISSNLYKTLSLPFTASGPICIKYSHQVAWDAKDLEIRGHYNWDVYDVRIASYTNEKPEDGMNIFAYVYPNNKNNYIKVYRKGWDIYIVLNSIQGQWYKGLIYCESNYEIIEDISFIDDSFIEVTINIGG